MKRTHQSQYQVFKDDWKPLLQILMKSRRRPLTSMHAQFERKTLVN